MKQRAKNISYLVTAVVGLDTLDTKGFDRIALPQGANIIGLYVEAEDTEGNGTIDVELKEKQVKFLEGVSLDSSNLEDKFIKSSVHTQTNQRDVIRIRLNSGSFSAGFATLKVHYFLPSEILTEY